MVIPNVELIMALAGSGQIRRACECLYMIDLLIRIGVDGTTRRGSQSPVAPDAPPSVRQNVCNMINTNIAVSERLCVGMCAFPIKHRRICAVCLASVNCAVLCFDLCSIKYAHRHRVHATCKSMSISTLRTVVALMCAVSRCNDVAASTVDVLTHTPPVVVVVIVVWEPNDERNTNSHRTWRV